MRYYMDYGSGNKVQFGSVTFSERELKDLLKAWLAISLAFSMLLTEGFSTVILAFTVSSLTVGVGFIFHELGHKILAQKYGAWAEFRSWDTMLILGVLMSFFGFVFLAPGAVMISGKTIGKSRSGKISAIGPLMNFIMAILFLPLFFSYKEGILGMIGLYGVEINTWLGLFNLIPAAMFDGKKIFNWNKAVYLTMVAVGLGLMAVQLLV